MLTPQTYSFEFLGYEQKNMKTNIFLKTFLRHSNHFLWKNAWVSFFFPCIFNFLCTFFLHTEESLGNIKLYTHLNPLHLRVNIPRKYLFRTADQLTSNVSMTETMILNKLGNLHDTMLRSGIKRDRWSVSGRVVAGKDDTSVNDSGECLCTNASKCTWDGLL